MIINDKKLVLFDVDGVLLRGQSLLMLARFLFIKKQINLIDFFRVSLFFILYKFSIYKNLLDLRKQSFMLFSNLSWIKLEPLIDIFLKEYIDKKIQKKVVNVLNCHIRAGDFIVLISSSLDFIVQYIAKKLKIEYSIASKLEILDNIVTGKLTIDNYGTNKLNNLKNFIKENNISSYKKIFYSDHISDLELFNFVDYPVVINPDRELKRLAIKNGWQINIL
jgi:HAD superfamily hydrolase (TIGR01490 family)